MYKNIIWDLDGTLFDTYPAIAEAFLSVLRDHGRSGDLLEIRSLAQVSLEHCFRTLSSAHDVPANMIEEAFRKQYQQSDHLAQTRFPGARQVCEYICRIGGSNVIVTHRATEGTVGVLRAHHMDHLFRGWLAGGDGYPKKPDPAAFGSGASRCPTGAGKDPGNWR